MDKVKVYLGQAADWIAEHPTTAVIIGALIVVFIFGVMVGSR